MNNFEKSKKYVCPLCEGNHIVIDDMIKEEIYCYECSRGELVPLETVYSSGVNLYCWKNELQGDK